MSENQNEVGYSQFTGGANGLMTSGNCIGNPNTVALTVGVFAPGCVLYEKDSSTGYVELVWLNTGTTAVPAWTSQATTGTVVTKVTLTTAQILALNATPIALLPALVTGQIYDVLSVYGSIVYNSVAYTTHTELDIVDTTSGDILFKDASALLAATTSTIATIPVNTNSNVGVVVTNGGGISAKAATGNPAAGNSPVEIIIISRIVNL